MRMESITSTDLKLIGSAEVSVTLNGKFAALVAALACGFGCSFAQSQASTQANEVANHNEPAISFEWVDCERAGTPAVTIELWRDGHFRYVGSANVREIGERGGAISATDAKQIISLGVAVANKSRIPAIPLTREGDPTYPYCVRVSVGGENGIRKGIVASFEKRSRRLLSEIERAVDVKHKVCPTRGSDEAPIFRRNTYCDTDIIYLGIADENACASMREVEIFRDGTVHHWATLTFTQQDGTVVRKPVGDAYYLIPKDRVNELWDLALTYKPSGPTISEAQGDPSQPARGTKNDLLAFKEKLESVAGIQWIHIDVPASGCGKNDRGIPLLLVAVK
jgi:hypothetical protein